ncbi:uncharacterized protein LOC126311254 [Schistocerca gregaria]|uniref:uncharacterized protein LOC126311254 n=1 Tax=Schistocerca gregaria TaxID=7010 RepID=UPI00211E51A3|nr:uncharacterized protein LOC126311254 [Schistocerca gregaria]
MAHQNNSKLNRRIFVKNLSPEITCKELEKNFSFSGPIESILLQRNCLNDKTLCAVITFKSCESLEAACLLNDMQLLDSRISVEPYLEPSPDNIQHHPASGNANISAPKKVLDPPHFTENDQPDNQDSKNIDKPNEIKCFFKTMISSFFVMLDEKLFNSNAEDDDMCKNKTKSPESKVQEVNEHDPSEKFRNIGETSELKKCNNNSIASSEESAFGKRLCAAVDHMFKHPYVSKGVSDLKRISKTFKEHSSAGLQCIANRVESMYECEYNESKSTKKGNEADNIYNRSNDNCTEPSNMQDFQFLSPRSMLLVSIES